MRRYPISQAVWAVLSLAYLPSAQAAVTGLDVTLRGKKYNIPQDVQTVKELQQAVTQVSQATDIEKQSVLFEGKRLEPNAVLKDAGVTDGASLSMVPATSGKKKKKSSSSSGTTASVTTSTEEATNNIDKMMKDYLAKSGIDTSQLDELMKSMGGGDGEGGVPSMEESMEAMSNLMSSPLFKEFMSDPEKLEQSRQMILNTPMLKNMMAGMPGMADLLNDKNAWKEAMMAAATMFQHMDQDDLMKGIMSGLGGAAPPAAGLFDGMLDPSAASSTAAAALDELEEDD